MVFARRKASPSIATLETQLVCLEQVWPKRLEQVGSRTTWGVGGTTDCLRECGTAYG